MKLCSVTLCRSIYRVNIKIQHKVMYVCAKYVNNYDNVLTESRVEHCYCNNACMHDLFYLPLIVSAPKRLSWVDTLLKN